MSFNSLLNITVDIKSLVSTKQSNGETTTTLTTVSSNVRARRQPAKGTSINSENYQLSLDSYTFYMKISQANVAPQNIIVYNGEEYEIEQAEKDSSENHWQILTRRKHFD